MRVTKSEGSELLTSSCKLLESNSEPVNELCCESLSVLTLTSN